MRRIASPLRIAVLLAFATACSSSDSSPPQREDAAVDSLLVSTDGSARPSNDTRDANAVSADDTRPLAAEAFGNSCTTNADCDPAGAGINICSRNAFGGHSYNPTPVCMANTCDPGDGTSNAPCGDGLGECLRTSRGPMCFPGCSFDDTGAPPTGCIGKNRCQVLWMFKDPRTSAPSGRGFCLGGCRADTDCPATEKCQAATGLCRSTIVTYTKTIGTACVAADAKEPAKCNCNFAAATGAGYCTTVCYVGETSCPTGFTCDPGLPRIALRPVDVAFSQSPPTLAGRCQKNCSSDADCAGLSAFCAEVAGTGQRTCHVGSRPCEATTDCPSGTTCFREFSNNRGSCI